MARRASPKRNSALLGVLRAGPATLEIARGYDAQERPTTHRTSGALEGSPNRPGEPLGRWTQVPLAREPFFAGATNLGVLRSLASELCSRSMSDLRDEDVRRLVFQAFSRGRLVARAIREPPRPPLSFDANLEPVPPPELPSKTDAKDAWIEIRLVTPAGVPVPGERYNVFLRDGTQRDGELDGKGCARVEGIPRGRARVGFPDIDRGDWRRRGAGVDDVDVSDRFEVQLTDHAGRPLADVDLVFRLSTGDLVVPTDATGLAAVDAAGETETEVAFADLDALEVQLASGAAS